MKKMMFLTLAFSVMALGSAVANDGAKMEDRSPERVRINVFVDGHNHGSYADVLHMVFCPECRRHIEHRCMPNHHHHRKPHPHKPHKPSYRGDKGRDDRGYRGHGEDGGRGHKGERGGGHKPGRR